MRQRHLPTLTAVLGGGASPRLFPLRPPVWFPAEKAEETQREAKPQFIVSWRNKAQSQRSRMKIFDFLNRFCDRLMGLLTHRLIQLIGRFFVCATGLLIV